MTFGKAFELIENDGTLGMRLQSWHKNTCVSLAIDYFTSAYLVVRSDNGIVPWIPTYPEMFSNKWEVKHVENINEQ